MKLTEIKQLYEQYREENDLPKDKPKMSNKAIGPLLCDHMNSVVLNVAIPGVYTFPCNDRSGNRHRVPGIKFDIEAVFFKMVQDLQAKTT